MAQALRLVNKCLMKNTEYLHCCQMYNSHKKNEFRTTHSEKPITRFTAPAHCGCVYIDAFNARSAHVRRLRWRTDQLQLNSRGSSSVKSSCDKSVHQRKRRTRAERAIKVCRKYALCRMRSLLVDFPSD